MKRYLDQKLSELWYSRPGFIACLLWPFSLLYRFVCFLRRLVFKCGFISIYQASVPVIVVGNITVGGVGKTPVVSALAKHVMKKGKTVGIVSRGYGGESKEWPQQVTAKSDPRMVGDEPVMLARQLGCHVVVSPRRVDAIQLCESLGCDIIFSDDGLTHYYFKRNQECVVVDAVRGFGNGFCLPAGPLRTPASLIHSKQLVLTNTAGVCDDTSWHIQPLVFVSLFQEGVEVSLKEFEGKTIHAVAAIGNNMRFFDTLRSLGCDVLEHSFPDHYSLSDKDVLFSDARPVIMTEKDAVKCSNLNIKNDCWYLKVEANIHPSVYEKIEKIAI